MTDHHAGSAWEFWIDRGGTFTDIVARRPDGTTAIHKLLSDNPEQYRDSAVQGIRDILGIEQTDKVPIEKIRAIKMGTTVATNALLERKGEPTLLLTTKGFRDALRIGYQNRPDLFALNIELPEQLYAAVQEVDERINASGEVLVALDEADARASLKTSPMLKNLSVKAEDLQEAIKWMLDNKHCREIEVVNTHRPQGGRKPATNYEVNPTLL